MSICNIKSLFFIALVFASFSVSGLSAQTTAIDLSETQNQISRNENFELNIVVERIVETNFKRSTSAKLRDESRGNLCVEVGALVQANQINALLRGISGRVTFRASLELIQKRIEQIKMTAIKKSP